MSAQFNLVRLDGQTYCAGLFWYPLETGPGAPQGQLESMLEEQSAAYYVTRGRPAYQVGLVGQADLADAGLPSIALSVADTLTRNGHKSFLVALACDQEDTWCYVVQNQGLLQFDGDIVGTAASVRSRIEVDLAAGVNWDLIVAPADWAVSGAQQWERDKLLPNKSLRWANKASYSLRAAQRDGSSHVSSGLSAYGMAMTGIALACVVMAGTAYWMWDSNADQLSSIGASHAQAQARFVAERPWIGKPLLADWGELCLQRIGEQALDVAGWQLQQALCIPATATLRLTWVRGTGALLEDLLALRPTARLVAPASEPARTVQIIALAPQDKHRIALPAAPSELMRRPVWDSTSSRWNEQWSARRPLFVIGAEASGTTPIVWTWSDSVPPVEVLHLLDLPATVLDSMELNVTKGKNVWTMKASHHVRK
jgi:Pilin accessory protein (PilO)